MGTFLSKNDRKMAKNPWKMANFGPIFCMWFRKWPRHPPKVLVSASRLWMKRQWTNGAISSRNVRPSKYSRPWLVISYAKFCESMNKKDGIITYMWICYLMWVVVICCLYYKCVLSINQLCILNLAKFWWYRSC